MRTSFISHGLLVLLLTACNNGKPYSSDDRAVNNARTYLQKELGNDADKYEEGNWGRVEAREVSFEDSRTYKMFSDTLAVLNARLASMSDSMNAEFAVNGTTPRYQSIKMRRDALAEETIKYQNGELALRQRYQASPEYDGYWIYHEYKLNGEPKKVYILMRDTANYEPVQVIYK